MLCNKKRRKFVQIAVFMVLVTVLAWPLPASAQAENAAKGKKVAAEMKSAETDALVAALGGSEYAGITELGSGYQVYLKKSVTVNSGTLTVPVGIQLLISGENTLTLGESVKLIIEKTDSLSGFISVEEKGLMKVDGSISGPERSINLRADSSKVSSLTELNAALFTSIKTVRYTDLNNGRIIYAGAETAEENMDVNAAEAFIVRPDGTVMLYTYLGLGDDSALAKSNSGDMLYLAKDILEASEENENLTSVPIKAGVTLVIEDGQTLTLDMASLFFMGIPSEGSVLIAAGGAFEFPWNDWDDTKVQPVVGGENAKFHLQKGFFEFKFQPQRQPVTPAKMQKIANKAINIKIKTPKVILTKGSKGTVPAGKELNLRVMNNAVESTVEENAEVDVKGAMTVEYPGSEMIEGKNAKIRTTGDGFVFLDEGTKLLIGEGASFSTQFLDGVAGFKDHPEGFKTLLNGDIILEKKANLTLQDDKLIGGSDAHLSITEGKAEVSLNPNIKKLDITEGTKATLNQDWRYELKSKNPPNNNYLENLTIAKNSELTLNAKMTIPAGATLNLNGDMVVGPNGELILEDDAVFNNNGHVIVQPGGKVSGANSFELSPFAKKVFRTENEGYMDPETLNVTVKSNGTQNTGNLTATLSENGAESFSLSPSGELGNLAKGDAAKVFTVSPKTGLKEGTYEAEITVASSNISATFPVSFTVKKAGGVVDPMDPTNPSNPTNPTDPSNPTNPSDPTSPTDPSSPSDPSNPSDPSTENKGKAGQPRTGDDTPIAGWIVLLLCAVAGGTAAVGYRRKYSKKE